VRQVKRGDQEFWENDWLFGRYQLINAPYTFNADDAFVALMSPVGRKANVVLSPDIRLC